MNRNYDEKHNLNSVPERKKLPKQLISGIAFRKIEDLFAVF